MVIRSGFNKCLSCNVTLSNYEEINHLCADCFLKSQIDDILADYYGDKYKVRGSV